VEELLVVNDIAGYSGVIYVFTFKFERRFSISSLQRKYSTKINQSIRSAETENILCGKHR
jgi:hypothetical protein